MADQSNGARNGAQVSSHESGDGSDGGFLTKSSGPLELFGVAVLGVAGAIAAVNARNRRNSRSRLASTFRELDLPSLDEAIDWIEESAQTVSRGSDHVVELSEQARSIAKILK